MTQACAGMRRQHPWFTLHLPRYLAVMQADTIASTAMIDEEIVHEVCKLGFKRDEVIESIKARAQNKVHTLFLPHPPPLCFLVSERVKGHSRKQTWKQALECKQRQGDSLAGACDLAGRKVGLLSACLRAAVCGALCDVLSDSVPHAGHGGVLPDVRQQAAHAQQRVPARRAHRSAQPPPRLPLRHRPPHNQQLPAHGHLSLLHPLALTQRSSRYCGASAQAPQAGFYYWLDMMPGTGGSCCCLVSSLCGGRKDAFSCIRAVTYVVAEKARLEVDVSVLW